MARLNSYYSSSRHVASRVAVVVLLASLLSMVGLGMMDFRDREARLDLELTRIENTVTPSIGESLWSYDKKMIASQLDGLSRNPHILYAEVSESGDVIVRSGAESAPGQKGEEKRIALIYQKNGDTPHHLGELRLIVDYDALILESVQQLIPTFFALLFLTGVLGVAFFWIFEQAISKNLREIAAYLSALSPDRLDVPLTLPPETPTLELVTMVAAINKMRTDLHAAQRSQAYYLEHLEELVEDRTSELVKSNAETMRAMEALKSMQAELVRSEKMAGLGSLVAGVAHELNTPIGNAVMVASTLADSHRSFSEAMQGALKRSTLISFSGTVGESCQILTRNLERAAHLISSFKQVAVDQSSYQRRQFALSEVVEEISQALAPSLRHSGTKLSVDVPEGIMLDSYPGPLGQVLMNLINNAMVHGYGPDTSGPIFVRARQKDTTLVELSVSDEGKGIPAEYIGRVFDPFFTTRLGQGGSGLGLNIVYTLVADLLRGTIEVNSEVGKGTVFRVLVPNKPDSPSESKQTIAEESK